jgi:hypothetical protein
VRGWIRRGELRAINTAPTPSGRPRFVVTPDSLAEFERSREVTALPKPAKRRKRITRKDYYPE